MAFQCKPFLKTLPFLLSLSHSALATIGTVNIDQLLSPSPQQLLSPETPPPPPPNPHAPWSYKPHCLPSKDYCVYTSNSTHGASISIVTSPKLATHIADSLAEDPLVNFLTQDQAEYLYYNAPPYEVVDVAGKGKGVVATRRIKKFETFMVDRASVAVDLRAEEELDGARKGELLSVAVGRLGGAGVVMGLAGMRGGEVEGEEGEVDGERVEDIMVTNAFGTTIAGESFSGLFAVVSRINHACNPNSFILFSQAGVSVAIKAYRDIEPGEEITISYLLFGLPSSDRQEALKRWDFKCTCTLCSQPASEKATSDARRKSIASTGPQIQALLKESKINTAIKLAEDVLENMKAEDLVSMLPDQYTNLVRMNLQAGDQNKAEEYAEEALELLGGMGFLGTEWEGEWDLKKLLGVLGEQGLYT